MMGTVISLLASTIIAALGRIGIKLIGPEFVEAVLTKSIVFGLEKLAPMTSNTLDDELVAEVKKRLKVPNETV